MQSTRKPVISARKKPRQARSAQLVADILEAAIRVLVRDGGKSFTTIRVAEEAGVSVGSLYQYFPNREALLFRLQADEWVDTWGILEEILADDRVAPLDRLRNAVLTFFRSEREEATLRAALDDAGALFRDAPEARAHFDRAVATVLRFVESVLPGAPDDERRFTARFLMRSMGSVAESITQEERSRSEVDAWARASAEMYCAYLERLAARDRAAQERSPSATSPPAAPREPKRKAAAGRRGGFGRG